VRVTETFIMSNDYNERTKVHRISHDMHHSGSISWMVFINLKVCKSVGLFTYDDGDSKRKTTILFNHPLHFQHLPVHHSQRH
jgi:hypothetical protein